MATRNLVPRADGEGSLGTPAKQWGAMRAKEIYINGVDVGQGILDTYAKADEALVAAEEASLSKETAQEIFNSILAQYGYPFTAATAADMTDTSKIYVYVGNEAGYVNGNWYYNNGTAWVSGGTFNAQAVQTDTTLSVAGSPADAKATGDAIKSTKSEMSLFGVDDLLWDNTNPESKTQNGITFTVDNVNDSVAVSGTSTGLAVLNFWGASSGFPSWLTKGQKYHLHYNNDDVSFLILYNTATEAGKSLVSTKYDTEFVIPSTATALTIRLSVASNVTVNTIVRPSISISHTLFDFDKVENQIANGIGTILPTWESGGINTSTGAKTNDATKIRTKEFLKVVEGETIVLSTSNDAVCPVIFYNADYSYNSFVGGVQNFTKNIVVPANAVYMKMQLSNNAQPTDTITDAYGVNATVLRIDGDLYKTLQYIGFRWLFYNSTNFTTLADIPINSITRIPRDLLNPDIETLPYYNQTEYYILSFGNSYNGNKIQIAIEPLWSMFYMRKFDTSLNAYGDWNSLNTTILREYTAEDLNDGEFINVDQTTIDNQAFNAAQRIIRNQNYKSLLIPVKAGCRVFLNTSSSTTYALPYGKFTYNLLFEEAFTEGAYFNGFVDFDEEGYIAVNVWHTQLDKFVCKIFMNAGKTLHEAQFPNAIQSYGQSLIPQYDDDNPCRVLKTSMSMMGSIHSWGIVGASRDSGELNHSVPGYGKKEIEWYEYSPWEVLKRINGIKDMYIYADGGQNAKEWITLGANTLRGYAYASDTEVQNPYWSGRSGIGYGGGCWWKMKEDYENGDIKQAFVVNLGVNDLNNNYPHNEDWTGTLEEYDESLYYECGTVDDIGTYDLATDTDTVPPGKTAGVVPGVVNSFCAYIGAVLNRIIAIQPTCLIFLTTIRNGLASNTFRKELWEQYNDALRQIAQMPQYADNVYILDMGKYGPNDLTRTQTRFTLGPHRSAMGYHYLAYYFNTLIDYVILKNYPNNNMRQSPFIGTGKHWDENDL